MPDGARSMKGEKQMIYKNITFKADPFSYNLEFDDRITLVGGNSGTGKTVLYEMLEDLRLTNEYKAIKLFNYKSDNFSESIEKCRDSFIVVDNADNLINDEIRRFINFEPSNQYMLFLRNCDGLNVSDKSFKVLKRSCDMKYLWTEDTGAGLHFWKLVNQLFFNDLLVVESKESNQGLLDTLSDIDM